MQTILTYLALLLTGLLMHAQNTIEVSISGSENNDMTATVALIGSEDTYSETQDRVEVVAPEQEVTNVAFSNVPDDFYVISVEYDETTNGDLNMIPGFYPCESSVTQIKLPTILDLQDGRTSNSENRRVK